MTHKLSKRQRRRLKNEGLLDVKQPTNTGIYLKPVVPKTENQELIFENFNKNHLFVHGSAGTGKTFVLLYLALKSVLNPNTPYDRVKIFRSAVTTRRIGYLPGNIVAKMESFELPYDDIVGELVGRDDAYAIMKHKELIEFHPTSFLRGATYNNSIVLVDECQNLTWHEFSSLITRCGRNSKYLFSGDSTQSDLERQYEFLDIHRMIQICESMPSFELVEMEIDDIVRSGLVKEFLIHSETLGYAA